jgi:magnesium-transporting ATPase (P-type)
MVSNSYKENLIKNAIIIIIAAFLWPVISNSINQIGLGQISDFLLIISMLLVTVCFANFAFTYEKSKLDSLAGKLLSHSATFTFILLIALLLESIVLAVKIIYPSFYTIIFGFTILLYIGIVLYDFWDFLRVK